ncbi:TIGR02186 family protein [Azospirillum sp. SYSU D00513]|uniref:TIGR02186 family protein n=1 Tax=Azospirillum sp. SYSU D00513 TaxID=2812561 RepID=UPI001A966E7A|nr:TIGR02186 family protein [Azospirillum sp. SYSU D00513]
MRLPGTRLPGKAMIVRAAAGLAGLAAGVTLAANVWGQQLVADLSSHLVAINTGFTGTDVVLFGSTDGQGDVAIVVTGPRGSVTVRRKDRVAGIWLNTQSVRFEQVPAYYAVATSRPLDQVVDRPMLERHQIGLPHLQLDPGRVLPAEDLAAFRAALIRNKQREGLYGITLGQVAFLGERLFRTNIYFPANVPTGMYTVEAMLIRDGEVVTAQTTPLVVSKVGFSAEIYEIARHEPVAYGVAAVIGAIAAGWLAGAIFRRI